MNDIIEALLENSRNLKSVEWPRKVPRELQKRIKKAPRMTMDELEGKTGDPRQNIKRHLLDKVKEAEAKGETWSLDELEHGGKKVKPTKILIYDYD